MPYALHHRAARRSRYLEELGVFGDDAEDLDAVDETLVLVEFDDQPLLVLVQERLLPVIVENQLGRRRKLQRTTRIDLKRTRELLVRAI